MLKHPPARHQVHVALVPRSAPRNYANVKDHYLSFCAVMFSLHRPLKNGGKEPLYLFHFIAGMPSLATASRLDQLRQVSEQRLASK